MSLFRAAAFRHKQTGHVFETGNNHVYEEIPGFRSEDWRLYDDGFTDRDGTFFTREEATQTLRAAKAVHAVDIINPPKQPFWS